MRAAGLKNGAVSHYWAAQSGTARPRRSARRASPHYPPGMADAEPAVIKALRRETPRRILRRLMGADEPGIEFADAREGGREGGGGKAPSTVPACLPQLVSGGPS